MEWNNQLLNEMIYKLEINKQISKQKVNEINHINGWVTYTGHE